MANDKKCVAHVACKIGGPEGAGWQTTKSRAAYVACKIGVRLGLDGKLQKVA